MGLLGEFKQYNNHLREFAMYKRLEGENIRNNDDSNDPDNNRQTAGTVDDSASGALSQWTVRIKTSITCSVVAIIFLAIVVIFIMIFLISNKGWLLFYYA